MENRRPLLWLMPVGLGESGMATFAQESHRVAATQVQYWIVEQVRTARRMLSSLQSGYPFDEKQWFEIGKEGQHEALVLVAEWRTAMRKAAPGSVWGLMSEAGMPGIADPGAAVVGLAHELGWEVRVLPGPSSIFMALALSGFNGQQFAFHGYLPVDPPALQRTLQALEAQALRGIAQIFIETPYRTHRMLETLLRSLKPQTGLAVTAGLESAHFFSYSGAVASWKGKQLPEGKVPAVFVLGSTG
jgi:16S rRNA (cytidine1402-2'-O)-methyltransferase